MFAASLITFRETLEAALVVGIILSYLSKTNQRHFKKFVWYGIAIGVALSLLLAYILNVFFGGLSQGAMEQLFEGTLMFVAAGFLTWMILWVHRQKEVVSHIKKKVAGHIKSGYGLGIFLLSASSVLREGTESVLYLKAISLAGSHNQLIGAIFGIFIALFLGFLLFSFAVRIKLKTIFQVTTIFLLLFAAGLVSSGVHELQEAHVIPIFSFDPLFNLSMLPNQESIVGSFLKTLFGYTVNPTLLQLTSYGLYISFILWFEKMTTTKLKIKAQK